MPRFGVKLLKKVNINNFGTHFFVLPTQPMKGKDLFMSPNYVSLLLVKYTIQCILQSYAMTSCRLRLAIMHFFTLTKYSTAFGIIVLCHFFPAACVISIFIS